MRTTVVFALAFAFIAAGSRLCQPTAAQKNDPPQFAEATRLSQTVAELYQKGKYDQALPLAKRVVEMAESTFGPSDVHVAVALQNLAEIQLAKKSFAEAEKSFERVVKIFASGPERQSDFAVAALRRLASLRYDDKDYEGSAELLERVLDIMEKTLGKNDLKLIEILWELANAKSANHEISRAEHIALQALRMQEQYLGPSHPETLKSMQRYACGVVLVGTDDLKTKEDDSEFSDDERTLNARAICLVGQLRSDCRNNAGKPLTSISLARGSVINDRATHLKLPFFPGTTRVSKSHSTAYVAILIDESGKVINAKPVCGDSTSRFIGVSLSSARDAVFPPTEVNGKQVQIVGFLTFTFDIR
jgi:hypothetical protein